ncbi:MULTISPECIES: NUDIX hydrolase [Mesonia]|uniref:Nudix hydrolase NudL n=1 Tax=Mesonia oceanica TaxID=2687242 RepID=A0AC61Y4Q5_9FLAO|nr:MULTISPECIES: CoA pyrophosphatase [Mesonia]MAN28043.1 coenzyme A pyrophosphatase [Mesonia sp.]MAQ42426.1 coenzyme A pyrophosphatase [Mesonia sp.]MBJ96732.1 coenzyme A pyrophosphatase [Flavobacteriaceae bacterium]VVU99288.1 putative Nudix hydrolase NudL [Mesonia oceanica]|tara:strand:- start:2449 stop:3090 length:642 start_codon:yes stop_codon:yes gene_type:complete
MTFSEFKNSVSKIEKIQLIGEKAHLEMAPNFRKKEIDRIDIASKNPKRAGVMALFYPNAAGETCLTLILRKTYKGVHSAQIGFPGGREEEEDRDLMETALRETHEEVGVAPEEIKVLKKLTKIYIPPSNFWVQPYLGIAEQTPQFMKQESEVEEILEVSLKDFLNDRNLIEKELSTSYAKNVLVPAFYLNEQIVWGATGMMLNEVKGILKEVL